MPSPEPGSRGHVLLVEDNVLNQIVAVGILNRLGYSADVAGNGRDALEALERGAYGAVLMDCRLPVMDGYQAAAEIRRREGSARHTPIIAMTASGDPGRPGPLPGRRHGRLHRQARDGGRRRGGAGPLGPGQAARGGGAGAGPQGARLRAAAGAQGAGDRGRPGEPGCSPGWSPPSSPARPPTSPASARPSSAATRPPPATSRTT
jgi:CheY-like chemotaxis protein